jgi:hypothetical protein
MEVQEGPQLCYNMQKENICISQQKVCTKCDRNYRASRNFYARFFVVLCTVLSLPADVYVFLF